MKIARVKTQGQWCFATPTLQGQLQLFPRHWTLNDLCEAWQAEVLGQLTLGPQVGIHQVDWGTPIAGSEKIICIGKNYADHAKEMGGEAPELPVVFSKFASTLLPHRGVVVLPTISQQVDYEAELVVVIGREGRYIPQSQAWQHVLGYTCGNDISARDWQKGRPGGQWLLGKTFDTFAPLGPWLVTADEVPNPHDLEITMRLNGQVMQQASTSLLIYPIDYLIAHVSQFFTLRPGDLIFTGTPAGVGAGRNPPVFLKNGDRMEVEISRIGCLENSVRAE
jgi:2-keto-4-pentenoate hydratase/2-oxohepta-3-ene-1,7-dioic acid hydratase in catechol pathway